EPGASLRLDGERGDLVDSWAAPVYACGAIAKGDLGACAALGGDRVGSCRLDAAMLVDARRAPGDGAWRFPDELSRRCEGYARKDGFPPTACAAARDAQRGRDPSRCP